MNRLDLPWFLSGFAGVVVGNAAVVHASIPQGAFLFPQRLNYLNLAKLQRGRQYQIKIDYSIESATSQSKHLPAFTLRPQLSLCLG